MAATMTIGLGLMLACRSEAAATPTPAASDGAAIGRVEPAPGGAISIAPASGYPATLGTAGAISYAPDRMGSGISFLAADGAVTGIQVAGLGRAVGVPDLALLTLGVEASRDTVEAARNDAADAMDKVIAALRSRGVAERDIQTRYFSIYPRYDRDGREITGYQVSNQVTAKVRNLNAVGNIIDDAAKAGGNLARFQSISFTIESTKALEEQARTQAVADMLARAKQLATLTGVELGKPTSIIESSGSPPVVPFVERAMLAAPAADVTTPVLAGEMEVVVTLQGVFAIQ
jgi:uncharacterized protein YggE